MEPIKCFFLEETNNTRRYLRRYNTGRCEKNKIEFHDTMIFLDIVERKDDEKMVIGDTMPHNMKEWPKSCVCGYEFRDTDRYQVFLKTEYRRVDEVGKVYVRDEIPVGGMWYADWYPWKGDDGHSLMLMLPGNYEWNIDGRANNCTLPNDGEHRCWVRHGIPPNITVDKNGKTCSAGGGSIMTPNFHGFLRNGYIVC